MTPLADTPAIPGPGTRAALFARSPEPGFVKTRLISTLGRDGAVELYRGMLADALRAVEGVSAERRMLYLLEPDRDGGGAACAQPFAWRDVAGVEVREQRGAGLGERLSAAFAELLDARGTRAVVFGADCPALDAATLDRALAELERHDVVLGPASDGGYVLIGLARPCASLFEGVPWSTDRVLERTLERAREAGLTTHLMPMLADVDTAGDVVELLEAWARGRELGPETRVALEALGLAPPPERA
jgi:rSAM/selenodomain-associated transferase 1